MSSATDRFWYLARGYQLGQATVTVIIDGNRFTIQIGDFNYDGTNLCNEEAFENAIIAYQYYRGMRDAKTTSPSEGCWQSTTQIWESVK